MVFKEGDPKNDRYPFMRDYTSFLKPMERPLVGRQREMQQLMAAMSRPELCNAILLAEAGSGKALDNDTDIPVADKRGYVKIKDLRVGDKVFDESGKPTTVLGVYPQGMKSAYKVILSDGTSVVCNDEHLWAARTRYAHYENAEYQTLTLREMLDYGIIRQSSDNNMKSWYIPMSAAVERDSKQFPIHPYVMGALIGDGCLSTNKKSGLEFSSSDEAVVNRIADLIGAKSAVFTKSDNHTWVFERKDPAISSRGTDIKYVQMHELADLGDFDCVFNTKSINRRIPAEYMLGSIEQRFELLRGLMDTDGTVTGNDRVNCKFATGSKGLAEDVVELVTSLGMRATITEETRDNKNTEYCVHISCRDDEKSRLFWLDKHKDKISRWTRSDKKFNKHYDDIAIADVVDLGYETEMTCIYVDSPNHLFQCTRNYIVTHNTALVQGTMAKDTDRAYLEVDLPRMISNLKNENEMADKLKQLFNEVEQYRKSEGKEVVLFIDEFHQIVQLSPAAVEVLKPLLADSGTRGIRVIAATTYIEFQQYIASNLPLVERLQRINLAPPNRETVVSILRGMAERYGVGDQFKTDSMFDAIYDYTNRYIPANAQPRKSILMLDSMIGWHRLTGKPIDMKMLADVIYETEGINIAFRVDATKIKAELDKKVLSQSFATTAIENRLQICCADLNNKNKPMSSFLFTGSTGVGKAVDVDTPIPVYTEDGSVAWKRNGDLKIGDYVFNREGKPVPITGVYPQGVLDVYEVELTDGRKIRCNGEHIWTYKSRFGNGAKNWRNATTTELMEKYQNKYYNEGRTAHNIKFVIPMNQPVQWAERRYKLHPYVLGAALGNGCLKESCFIVSSADEDVIARISELIGADRYENNVHNYNWHFYVNGLSDTSHRRYQTNDVLSEVPELIGVRSGEKFIPCIYKTGSIEQRWELIRGLFDTDGTIDNSSSRYNVSYSTSSKRLAYDIQEVLYSLGVSSSVSCHHRDGKSDEYDIHVKIGNSNKSKLFWVPRKKNIAIEAAKVDEGKQRVKKFGDVIGIRDIRKLDEQAEMLCIMVDDPEHLYQAGDFIVTHNTETAKSLAEILFEDDRCLVRMDMTEYALPESLERFREELTRAVWTRPYSIVLLDEIEKSCAPVTRLLLQVLDDGRLLDKNNREVTFKNAYIIVTTNAGSEIYKTIAQYNVDDTGSGKMMEKYEALIKESIKGTTGGGKFPPELLGRIDCLVPFQPLSEQTMMNICKMRLEKLKKEILKKHRITTFYDKRLIDYIVKDKMTTDSDAGGARAIVSRIDREITMEIAKFINSNPHFKDARNIYVCIEGELASENKNRLESSARVVVSSTPPRRTD